ncbi:MAG: DUF1501 domain-containing protein [Kofleriaceae bacterium]
MLNRRTFLGLGGAAIAATASTSLWPRRARAAAVGTPKNLLIVLAQGGWDVTFALDPKVQSASIDVPVGAVQNFGNLDIFVDATRPAVTGFFDRYAAQSAVIRGIMLSSIAHPECVKRMMTGTRSNSSPDLAAIVAQEHARDLPVPYLILGDSAFTGPYAVSAGRVGATNQIVALANDAQRYPILGEGARFTPTPADEARIRAYLDARASRERAVRGAVGYNKKRIDDFSAAMSKADRLVALRAGLGTRGRTLALDAQADLAIDAITGGIARSVTLDSRLSWDSHTTNAEDQTAAHEALYTGITRLADLLTTTPGATAGNTLLDETVVLVMSEFSRTPKLNAALGKDHWPVTSALVFGGGVKGGRAYGGTSASLDPLLIDYATGAPSASGKNLESKNFAAGILSLCGVDPAAHLPSIEAFDVIAK